MSDNVVILFRRSLFLIILLMGGTIGFAVEAIPAFENEVQAIGASIQDKELSQAQTAVDQFWAEHNGQDGFVDAVRRIKDYYWANEFYIEHFELCGRIVEAFPNDPLSIGIQVDQVTGYIKLKDMIKAAEELDRFWGLYSSDERFVDFARRIKDQYWMDGYYAEHFSLCEQLVSIFPNDPLVMNLWADMVTGYIRTKDMPKAAEKLEVFWNEYSTIDGFIQHVKYVKDQYWASALYQEHFEQCRRLIQSFPEDPATLAIWADMVTGYIRLNEMDTAAAELEEFWAACSGKEGFIQLAKYIKDVCWAEGEYPMHFDVCERINNTFQADPSTMQVRIDEVTGYLKRGNMAEAESLVQQFLAEPHTGDEIVEFLNPVAVQYHGENNFQRAAELYQIAKDSADADDPRLVVTEMGQLAAYMAIYGDPNFVQDSIDQITADNADNPYLAEALVFASEEYYRFAKSKKDDILAAPVYEEGLEILEKAIPLASDNHQRCMAFYMTGLYNRRLGNWSAASDAFFESIDAEPQFEWAGTMHWMISDSYKRLKENGEITAEEADPIIEWGYQMLFDKYPNSRDVRHAALQLARLNMARGRTVPVLFYVNWLLDDLPVNDPRKMHILQWVTAEMEECRQ